MQFGAKIKHRNVLIFQAAARPNKRTYVPTILDIPNNSVGAAPAAAATAAGDVCSR